MQIDNAAVGTPHSTRRPRGAIVSPNPGARDDRRPGDAPLLDDCNGIDTRLVGEAVGRSVNGTARGVRPYGGGHPTDWPWGCGGSPFRTGPGMCDTYRVGPIWNVAVDGMVMKREGTDLAANLE